MSFCNPAERYSKLGDGRIVQYTIKLWLANLALRAYHSLMDSQIPAQNGKFVTKLTTLDGVVGYVACDVPESAMQGLLKKLLARKAELERGMSDEPAKTAIGARRRSKVSVSF